MRTKFGWAGACLWLVVLAEAVLARPPANAPQGGLSAAPDWSQLIAALPASLDVLAQGGAEAAAALDRAMASDPAERPYLRLLAVAAVRNRLGDPASAKWALRQQPAEPDSPLGARSLYEAALAAELSGDSDVVAQYTAAAESAEHLRDAITGQRAWHRLVTLHKFAGRWAEAKAAGERRAKLAVDSVTQTAARAMVRELDRAAAVARSVPAPELAVHPDRWRLRLLDTFAAHAVSYPGYAQFFLDGRMQIHSGVDRPNRFPVGLYSGGGVIRAGHLIAEFDCQLRTVLHPEGRWTAGFAVRCDPEGNSPGGVTVQFGNGPTLLVEGPDGPVAVEPAVYRPIGRNRFRVVAIDRRVEIWCNGLPVELVWDAAGGVGGLELLALGCLTDYFELTVWTPTPPGAAKVDNARAARLAREALADIAADRMPTAIAKFVELLPLTEPDCESRLYLLRLLRAVGTAEHQRLLGDLWPDKIAPQHWLTAAQARLEIAIRAVPAGEQTVFRQVREHLARGQHEPAVELLDGLLRQKPNHHVARETKCEVLMRAENFQAAAAECETVLKADPKSLLTLLRLVVIAQRTGDVRAEIRALERLLKDFPALPEAEHALRTARRRLNPRPPMAGGLI